MPIRPALLTLLALPIAAQAPSDPTDCSTLGFSLFRNPDCQDAPAQWPLPANACTRASVLSIVGPAAFARAGLQGPFAFVTGHTDPATGREFALVCGSNGFAVVDTHQIAALGPSDLEPPILVRQENCIVPTPACGSIHRGTASFGEFVYESNSFRTSLRVTRVRVVPGGSPEVTLKAFPDVPMPPGASYRLTVDRERGHLYVPGAGGLHVYDVNGSNAGAPVLLAIWRGWQPGATVPSWDVHLHRQHGRVLAVVAEYLTTNAPSHVSILDVTRLPVGDTNWQPPRWVAWPGSVPGAGSVHSAWMPADGSYLYSSLGDVTTFVYDLRGFRLFAANRVLSFGEVPPLVQSSTPTPRPLVYPQLPRRHMGLQGIGFTGYASSWQDGFILYDLRPDCALPNEVLAQVDTSPCSPGSSSGGASCSGTYPGAFSTYRLQDSGVVYVTDETNGLFLVRLNVGHVHRFGAAVPETHAGVDYVPRITLEHAPARTWYDPLRDAGQRVTVRGIRPGRTVGLVIGTEAARTPVPFPDPSSPCRLWLGGFVTPPFLIDDLDNDGAVEIALPPGIPPQWRVFVQAFSIDNTGASPRCLASSRGTWFGMADPR